MHLLKTNPKSQFICFLAFFFISAMFHLSLDLALRVLVLCVAFSVITDLAFTYIRKRRIFAPYSAVISGLILALVIEPRLSWIHILTLSATAMGAKNFIRISDKHIFNPAAIGLLIGWIIFKQYPSWWAATLYSENFVIANAFIYFSLLCLCFISCYRYKRYAVVLSYLVSFAILSALFSSPISIQSLFITIVSPGILFYVIVMLTEPMTSPVHKTRQILYGFAVAFVTSVLVFVSQKEILGTYSSFPDSSIAALLIGNLLFFRYK